MNNEYTNKIYCHDSERMSELPDESIDALVTDPPSGIAFMSMEWDKDKGGRNQWIAWLAGIMREAYRVMKPGAHGLVWALPRTSHWTAMALEDAGFEVRDYISHIFSTGFPKSQSISLAIDKAAGAERKVIGVKPGHETTVGRDNMSSLRESGALAKGFSRPWMRDPEKVLASHLATAPATEEAKKWDGFGTALKPAVEFWILVRKPLSEKTIAANVVKYGTGGLNIEASRIGYSGGVTRHTKVAGDNGNWIGNKSTGIEAENGGRWPAHLVLSHDSNCMETYCVEGCQVAELDRQSGITTSRISPPCDNTYGNGHPGWQSTYQTNRGERGYTDTGGASRFFGVFHPCQDQNVSTSTVNDAGKSAGDGKRQRDIVQNHAVQDRMLDLETRSHSTNGMENGLGTNSDQNMQMIQVSEEKCSQEYMQESMEDCRNRAVNVEQKELTDITIMDMKIRSTSSGYAENVTSKSISQYAEVGGTDLVLEGHRFRYVGKPSVSEKEANLGDEFEPAEGIGAVYKTLPDPRMSRPQQRSLRKNTHPTVKPLELMRYLITLITPPGGIILDCFAGSGTTLLAADQLGFKWVGYEQNPEYVRLAQARLSQRSLFSQEKRDAQASL